MDPHRGAEVVHRLPERVIAHAVDVDAVVARARIDDAEPAFELLQGKLHVLQRQDGGTDEAVRMPRDPLRHRRVAAPAELEVGLRLGPRGALQHRAGGQHGAVDAARVHVLDDRLGTHHAHQQLARAGPRLRRRMGAEAAEHRLVGRRPEHMLVEHVHVEVDDHRAMPSSGMSLA